MKVPVFNLSGVRVREVELPADVFDVEPHRGVMHQALVRQLANARRGTANTQGRSDVSRTTKKMFRQKGTGRARHGSRTAPIFVGGGIAHGPHHRSYRQAMPKKMRRLALRSALSDRARDDSVALVEGLALETPRTKTVQDLIQQAFGGASTLVLLAESKPAVERSIRNLTHVRYLRAGYLNVRDVLGHDRLLIDVDAMDQITAHLGAAGATGGGD